MAVNYTDMPFFKSLNSYNRYLPTGRQVYQMPAHKDYVRNLNILTLTWNEISFGITLNKDVEIFVFT